MIIGGSTQKESKINYNFFTSFKHCEKNHITFSSMTKIIPSSSYIFCNDKEDRQCTYNVTQGQNINILISGEYLGLRG
jgi:hypothetical protein